MSPYLFVSDLDQTLLDDDGHLSSYTRSALTRWLGEGLAFTVASARSIHSITPILTDLPLTLPVIEFNGAFLTDLATNRHEVVNSLSPEDAARILGIVEQRDPTPYVSTFDGDRDNLYCPVATNPGMEYYSKDRAAHGDPRLREMVSLAKSVEEQVVSFTFIGKKEILLEARADIEAAGLDLAINLFDNWYSPGWYWLTLAHPAANKATAIKTLVERHGLGNHRIVVFGDQVNDVPMFRAADIAVAVSNAIPEVRNFADLVIGANTDNAVVDYIATLDSRSH